MNIIFTLKDFKLDISGNTFFEGANISDGNYDDDIDQRIDTFLITYRNKQIKSFTIPVSLSNNFMEFSGLIFAHHVRLTRELTFCDAPIIFYGTLELEQLLRLTPLARILLTHNIQYVNTIKYSFDDIQKSIERYEPKSFDIIQFLEQIQIKPPANYDSHHNIDNEFALIQWSRYIKSYNRLPQHFKKEFDSKLYFKYLRTKHLLSEINDHDQFIIPNIANTRILLIEDEAKMGWENFYESFFRNSKIKFEDSGIDFKNEEKNDLITKIITRVKHFDPDIVLLDLRLHDSDFGEDVESEKLTGIQILEKIKEINRGIQIIITTASNKAWNFNLAKQKGAYDFIIKNGYETPEKTINKLSSALKITAKRSFFLRDIGEKITKLKNLISINNYFNDQNDEIKTVPEKEDKIRKKLFSNFELAFELLDLSSEIPGKQKYFAYSYLQFFICIEEFLNIKEIFESGRNKCYVNKTILIAQKESTINPWTSSIKFIDEKPSYYIMEEDNNNPRLNPSQTDFKMSSILIYLFNQYDSKSKNWPEIREIRNRKAAHPEKGNVTSQDITKLLNFLLFIFNQEYIIISDKKGLPDEIKENDLSNLMNKLNSR